MKLLRLLGFLLVLAAVALGVGAWFWDAPGPGINASPDNKRLLLDLPDNPAKEFLIAFLQGLAEFTLSLPSAMQDLGGRILFGAAAGISLIVGGVLIKFVGDWEAKHDRKGYKPQADLVDVADKPKEKSAPLAAAVAAADDAAEPSSDEADEDEEDKPAEEEEPKKKEKASMIFSAAKPAATKTPEAEQAAESAHKDIAQLVQWEQISISDAQAKEVVARMYPDLMAWVPSFRGEALQAFAYRMIAIARNRLKLRDKTISPYQFSTFQNRVYQLEEETIGKQYTPADPDKVPADHKKDIGAIVDIKNWPRWQQELLAEKEEWKDISIKAMKEMPAPAAAQASSAEPPAQTAATQ